MGVLQTSDLIWFRQPKAFFMSVITFDAVRYFCGMNIDSRTIGIPPKEILAHLLRFGAGLRPHLRCPQNSRCLLMSHSGRLNGFSPRPNALTQHRQRGTKQLRGQVLFCPGRGGGGALILNSEITVLLLYVCLGFIAVGRFLASHFRPPPPTCPFYLIRKGGGGVDGIISCVISETVHIGCDLQHYNTLHIGCLIIITFSCLWCSHFAHVSQTTRGNLKTLAAGDFDTKVCDVLLQYRVF